MQGIIFFVRDKIYNGTFLGFFCQGLDLFNPKIALRYAQDNLGVKVSLHPHEKILEMPYYMFAREKNKQKIYPLFQNQRYINS